MPAEKRYKLGTHQMEISLLLGGRTLFPSLHKNPVTIEQKAIEKQVSCVQKGIYIIYGVQELCHWSWMG
jgi:hypothetical protein